MEKAKVSYWARKTKEEKHEHYVKYRESYQKSFKAYVAANKEAHQGRVHHAYIKRVYPALLTETSPTSSQLALWCKEHYRKPCPYCGGPSNSIDHKVPLTKGGQHEWHNLQLICNECNKMKNNRTPEEFMDRVMLIANYFQSK